MEKHRKISLTAGILYLITFVSIPTLGLYSSVKGDNYLLSSSSDNAAIIGAILEVIVALAGIGTAVVLFPILKKQNESASLALVAARILESACIFMGVVFVMSIVGLHRDGSDSLIISQTLASLYDHTFFQSQSFMPAIIDLLLGFLLFKSLLVPRKLSIIGIVGGPLLLISYFAVMFGLIEQHSSLAGASAILVAVFEFSLGIWLVVKGFNPKAVENLYAKTEI